MTAGVAGDQGELQSVEQAQGELARGDMLTLQVSGATSLKSSEEAPAAWTSNKLAWGSGEMSDPLHAYARPRLLSCARRLSRQHYCPS